MSKVLYIFVGSIALILGIIGIALPVLPTTPLLLLTLLCYSKASTKLNFWFRNTNLYKKHLDKYVQRNSLTLRQKLTVQVFASIMMIGSFIFLNNLILRIILVLCFIIHNYVFIFKIKTYHSED